MKTKDEDRFTIYPNPTGNWVKIDYRFKDNNVNARLEIHDLMGKIIHQQDLRNDKDVKNIDLSNIANGIYAVEIFNNNQLIKTQKLNVQH